MNWPDAVVEGDSVLCPICEHSLDFFSGLPGIPAHQYCPDCMDVAYDEDGKPIAYFKGDI